MSMDEQKHAMDLWEVWSEDQRMDFLSSNKLNANYASHDWNVDLPHDIRKAVMGYVGYREKDSDKREIKFRAWLQLTKKMMFMHDPLEIKGACPPCLIWNEDGSACLLEFEAGVNPDYDSAILMQYTGLKDKNGKEIYDGDIIKIEKQWADHIGSGRLNCLVGYKDGAPMFGRSDVDPYYMNSYLWITTAQCEVIGNVHETKNLLINTLDVSNN